MKLLSLGSLISQMNGVKVMQDKMFEVPEMLNECAMTRDLARAFSLKTENIINYC